MMEKEMQDYDPCAGRQFVTSAEPDSDGGHVLVKKAAVWSDTELEAVIYQSLSTPLPPQSSISGDSCRKTISIFTNSPPYRTTNCPLMQLLPTRLIC